MTFNVFSYKTEIKNDINLGPYNNYQRNPVPAPEMNNVNKNSNRNDF